MKNYLPAILIIMIFSGLAAQENRLFWDGGDWRRLDKLAAHNPEQTYHLKAAYINGVLDGRLFYYLKTWRVNNELADSLFAETVDYLSTRELVTAIDNFYADPLHTYVPVPSAVIIATMYAEQLPLTEIDEYIRQTKFWINDMQLKMEQEDWNKLLDDKLDRHLRKTAD